MTDRNPDAGDPGPVPLGAWLAWAEGQHPSAMEFTLERVRAAAVSLGLLPAPVPVITVAGTNGKGTTAAVCAELLRARGLRVGLYTSPHLLRFNERIAVDGVPADDGTLAAAFARIAGARTPERAGPLREPLTYFELATLVALDVFRTAGLDRWVLEIGLGGRLDAVNIVDPDVAVVTAIGLDHAEYLGTDLEGIGAEKAAIARPGRPLVVADPDAPASVPATGRTLGAAPVLIPGEDHDRIAPDRVRIRGPDGVPRILPVPPSDRLEDRNVLAALQAVACLGDLPPDPAGAVARCAPAGRRQRGSLPDGTPVILDVAHNPHAAAALARWLRARGERVHAVIGVLADKDAGGIVRALAPVVEAWYPVDTDGPRGVRAPELASRAGLTPVPARDVLSGLAQARAACREHPGAAVLVCGSFLTVAPVLEQLGTPVDPSGAPA